MYLIHFPILLASLLLSPPPAVLASNNPTPPSSSSWCQPKHISDHDQRALFTTYVDTIYTVKNFSAVPTYYAETYIQHNPTLPPGPYKLQETLSFYFIKNDVAVYRTAFDNSKGWVHMVLTSKEPDQEGKYPQTVVVDIFRWNGTCVQEHWDVVQAVPANKTNKLTMWGDGY
ncbi:putative snoal-like polyketide cyclase family protein [Curvularia clavata]|uniref:Snoal-like polyketide cyclase family protein n=1 Tax=Curvularia clavata TaxID=95742 RepID=A0A9Q9DU19_CURCL|nr:putative snoal-like polyketide cyclase family protein [Curvularia clavata]